MFIFTEDGRIINANAIREIQLLHKPGEESKPVIAGYIEDEGEIIVLTSLNNDNNVGEKLGAFVSSLGEAGGILHHERVKEIFQQMDDNESKVQNLTKFPVINKEGETK